MDESIRRKAEALLHEEYPVEDLAKDKDLPQILQELQIHQIELELQNDELRHTQEMLQLAQKKYFDLYNLAPVGYLTLDKRGIILDLNLTGAEMLGQSKENLLNRPFLIHLSSDSRSTFFEYLERVFLTNRRQTCELTLQTAKTATTFVQIESNLDDTGDSCRLVMTDISRRKEVEQALADERTVLAERVVERTAELRKFNAELTRTLRFKDQFLATMSQELKPPLQKILEQIEILRAEVDGALKPKQMKTAHRIEDSGQQLLKIMDDILELSKIEGGKLALYCAPLSIKEISEASLEFVSGAAAAKKIHLSSQFSATFDQIEADELRLRQILINLLSNAIRFTPQKGQVGLTVQNHSDDDHIEFIIWDTGIGVSKNDLEKMFQPFVPQDGAANRRQEGTKLTLALIRRLVQMHNGNIAVESTLNEGSRFTIILPRSQKSGAAQNVPPLNSVNQTFKPGDGLSPRQASY